MTPRNLIETLTDRLLMLFLIAESENHGWKISGKVKILKLLYLSECRMIQDKKKGFNFSFYRWDYGPMSNDALQDLNQLDENGLLEKSQYAFCTTSRGRQLLKNCSTLLSRNEEFLEYIRKVIREFGPYTGKNIKTVVYGTPKIGERKLIRKTKHGEELLRKLLTEEATKRFVIDDEWVETLSILLDKEACESLQKGMQDANEGRVTKYEPLKTIS